MASFGFRYLRDHSAPGQNKLRVLQSLENTNQCLGCLRMEDEGVLSHQTFLVKDCPFHQPLRKQDDPLAFMWVNLITNQRFIAGI